MQKITILGSTGSIGTNTLDVIARHPDQFSVFALSASTQVDLILSQCAQFSPRFAVMANADAGRLLRDKAAAEGLNVEVRWGADALLDIAEHPDVDAVMAAIVGAAGLAPCLAAARAGKRLLLANKEAIVVGGGLVHACRCSGWRDAAADRQRTFGDIPMPPRRPGDLGAAHRPYRVDGFRRPVSSA